MTSSSKLQREETVGADLLRGVAIVIVISFHIFCAICGAYLPWVGWLRNFGAAPSGAFLWFYPLTFGWSGVALFFVLSGFCIHYSFLRNRNFTVGWFFWRRFCRIYPAYLIALMFFVILYGLDFHDYYGQKSFYSHLLLLHNLREDVCFTINPSFWSIAVEWQLYLLYPCLLLVRRKYGISGCLWFTLGVGICGRVIAVIHSGLPDHLITAVLTFPSITWFDWALGACVAENFAKGVKMFQRPKIWLWVFLPLFFASTFFKPLTIFSFSLAAICSAVILDWTLHRQWKNSVALKIMVPIGTISYSLYLLHQPILCSIYAHWHKNVGSIFVSMMGGLVLVVFLAWNSYYFIERPGIRWGQLLWKRWRETSAVAQPARLAEKLTRD